MKVILKEYVYKHGVAGEVVDVASGFARNFLIPKGLAVKATKAALEENENLMAQSAIRRDELNDQLVKVANQIEGTELVFGRKAGSNGKLYGSVTTMDIADALVEKTGVDINRRRISERTLRELGTFDVNVRMSSELSPVVRVTVVREEELAEFLARGEEADEEAVAGESDEVEGETFEDEADAEQESEPQDTAFDVEAALEEGVSGVAVDPSGAVIIDESEFDTPESVPSADTLPPDDEQQP